MKVIIGILSFLFYTDLKAQTQAEMLDHLRKNIRVFYIANPNVDQPDIRAIKTATIAASTNGIFFGQSNNNGMNNSAQLLTALFSDKGDAALQQSVYKAMQQSKKSIVLHFVNDAASPIDPKFLSRYNVYVIKFPARTFIWPATYTSSLSNASDIHTAIVLGEYNSRNIQYLKLMFNELIENVAKGKYGPADKQSVTASKVRTVVRYDLPKLTKAQEDRWWRAESDQLGVIGNDYDGKDEIGTAPAERTETLFGTNRLDFWFPNVRPTDNRKAYKQTMIGKVTGAEHYENDILFPDYDVDFYVEPNLPFKYLIDESRKPNVNYISGFGNLKDLDWPSCPPYFKEVEAEIDLRDIHDKQFPAVFLEEMKMSASNAGFYGVWLWDKGHCEHPEIHPAEQIWWSYNKTDNVFTYRCNLIADYSGRYIKKSQYDGHGGQYTVMKPWAEPPISGVFAIPFKLKPGEERVEYRIFEHGANNVNANNSVSFDPFKVHHFVLNGKTLVTVIEPDADETMVISFEDVGVDASGAVMGFVVIKSAVGKYNLDHSTEPGHLFFEVKKSIFPVNKPPKAPGKIKVTLESIECTLADDDGDTEDIFGLILSSAYAMNDSVMATKDKLPFTSGMGSTKCAYGTEESLFCLKCPLMLEFTKGHKSTFGGYLVYDFPADGYIEITGNLDKAKTANCSSIDGLGVPQKKIIMTSEIGVQPYRFSQYFGSGKTMMKANYRVEKTR